jgi:hypothetical protein
MLAPFRIFRIYLRDTEFDEHMAFKQGMILPRQMFPFLSGDNRGIDRSRQDEAEKNFVPSSEIAIERLIKVAIVFIKRGVRFWCTLFQVGSFLGHQGIFDDLGIGASGAGFFCKYGKTIISRTYTNHMALHTIAFSLNQNVRRLLRPNRCRQARHKNKISRRPKNDFGFIIADDFAVPVRFGFYS